MPEMKDSGSSVSCATGPAWSAVFVNVATASPSAASEAAPISRVTIAAGSVAG